MAVSFNGYLTSDKHHCSGDCPFCQKHISRSDMGLPFLNHLDRNPTCMELNEIVNENILQYHPGAD